MRLLAAAGAVALATVVIFMQIGFRNGLFESSVRIHRLLDADIILLSKKSIGASYLESFSDRELYRVLGDRRVDSVSPVNWGLQLWRNPVDRTFKPILALGFEPSLPFLLEDELGEGGSYYNQQALNIPGRVIFDTLSRREFGVQESDITMMAHGLLDTEIEGKAAKIVGLVRIGPSFGSDGTVLMSRESYSRGKGSGIHQIEVGLVRLIDPSKAEEVARDLAKHAPRDIVVLTKEGFIQKEKEYWMRTTAIGLIFNFGVVLGIVGGIATIFQVLAANIVEHREEYATLEAMGYSGSYIKGIVAKQGLILTAIGFVPGLGVSNLLYEMISKSTRLPITMSTSLAAEIFLVVLGMNLVSGYLAIATTSSIDPAEILE